VGRNRKPPSKIASLIPRRRYDISPEQFATAAVKAERAYEESMRNLDKVEAAFAAEFAPLSPLTYFSLAPDLNNGFRAYIFFKTDADIERAARIGLVDRMEQRIRGLLEEFGRGSSAQNQIVLRLKSDESIRRVPGAYRFRLRECEVHGPGVWPEDKSA
jgi:hypothetical protein